LKYYNAIVTCCDDDNESENENFEIGEEQSCETTELEYYCLVTAATDGGRQLLLSTSAINEQHVGSKAKKRKIKTAACVQSEYSQEEQILVNDIDGVASYGCPEKFCILWAARYGKIDSAGASAHHS
jgi:hypothetical protein